MKTSEELRPVEAFYLMSRAGHEEWSNENALAAVLAYLSSNGYIKAHKNSFKLTVKGNAAIGSNALWYYEINVLRAIRDHYFEDLINIVGNVPLKLVCLDLALFTKVKAKFLGFIPYKKTVFSSFGERTLQKLIEERKKIEQALERGALTKKSILSSHAFPSLAASSKFKYSAKDADDEFWANGCNIAMMNMQ